MKSIYEYIDIDNSSIIQKPTKNNRFWIHALENMVIEKNYSGSVEISEDGENWTSYKEYKVSKNDYFFYIYIRRTFRFEIYW